MTKSRRKRPKPVLAWAWAIENSRTGEFELCYWSRAARSDLIRDDGKPSPEARIIRVRIVPVRAARNLKRRGK